MHIDYLLGRNSAVDDAIDIDLDDPEVGVAATKIQAGFRGSKARKEVEDLKNKKNIDIKMPLQSLDQMEEDEEYVDDDDLVTNRMTPIDSAMQKTKEDEKEVVEEEVVDIDLEDLALQADRITEASRLTSVAQVNATGDLRSPGHIYAQNKNQTWQRPGSLDTNVPKIGNQTWPLIPGLCKYHSKFGEHARSCRQPCKFQTASKTGNGPTGRQ